MSIRIRLCADDYGISTAVNVAIRDLVVRGRLNATSVMVVAPSFCRSEAAALDALNSTAPRVAIGLHLTLTAPFRPSSTHFAPLSDGVFPPLAAMLRSAVMRRLRRDALAAEITSQLRTFLATFGHAPDFIDGHQHVHLFPQIGEALLDVMRQLAPAAWVRQSGRALPLAARSGDRKGLFPDTLSRTFRRRPTPPAIAPTRPSRAPTTS